MVGGGTAAYLSMAYKTSGQYRKQAILMFITSTIPWIGYVLYRLGISYRHIDYMPFTFFFVSPLFAIFLFHFKMFDLVPIARSLVFEKMRNPVFVLDNKNRIVDWNNEAGTVFAEQINGGLKGKTMDAVFKSFDDLHLQFHTDSDKKSGNSISRN